MTGCSAPNCSNHSRNGFKFYRFPADLERRNIWLMNCRRENWIPTQNDRLCSMHFEENQMEQNRADGKKRLLPYAVPTIFDVPNPPTLFETYRKNAQIKYKSEFNNYSVSKRFKYDVHPPSSSNSEVTLPDDSLNLDAQDENSSKLEDNTVNDLAKQVSVLKKKIAYLEDELKFKDDVIAHFLSRKDEH